ncbi:hypothetical protein B1813_02865 [Saccharomonospora piscinae]|uniref:DUF4429 domain-containing protein n=1 Tax=Saccharomonospora piscinae TaxID=687388 RepID=A0A1V9AD15_SACPI|nr:DUF4429 domain-containing protein [Saccharomonospora piscinae]OQO95017.1 hypothetical protein B1813_02865 [Saccharomonospora piscinae]
MAELTSPFGTWSFDGSSLRITPGSHRRVHKVRKALGELTVPLAAIAGASYEPGRKAGRVRVRLKEGADPLSQVAAGNLADHADPYQLPVEPGSQQAAEYLVDAVRYTPRPDDEPSTCSRFLLPGPAVPVSASVADGTVTCDGQRITIERGWQAPEAKRKAGRTELDLTALDGVEWRPASWNDGMLRLRPRGVPSTLPPDSDPNTLRLTWGTENELLTVLVAAAVVARLPHPYAPALPSGSGTPEPPGEAQLGEVDGVLRRLRELGELHRDGILDADEFAVAKQALLRRLSE